MSDEKKIVRPKASSESDQDEDELSEEIKTSEETFSPSFHKESQLGAEHISEQNFTAGSCSEPELLPCSQSDDSSDHSDDSVPIGSSQLHCSTCKRIKAQSSGVQDPETLLNTCKRFLERTTDESASFIRSEILQESLPGDGQQRSPNASRSSVQPDTLWGSLSADEIRKTDTHMPYELLSPERRALLLHEHVRSMEQCLSFSLSDAYQMYTDASEPFVQPETLRESHSGSTVASGPFVQPETLREWHLGAYQTSTGASGPFLHQETLRELHSGAHRTSTGASGPFVQPETLRESNSGAYQTSNSAFGSFLHPETLRESHSGAHRTSSGASGPFVLPETLREWHSGAYQTSTGASGPFLHQETLRESHSGAHRTSTGACGPFVQPETLRESHSGPHQTSTGAVGPETFQDSSPQFQPRNQPEAEEFPLFYIFLVAFQLYVLIDPTYFQSISTLSGLAIPPMFFQGEYLQAAPIWFLVISFFWLAIFELLFIL